MCLCHMNGQCPVCDKDAQPATLSLHAAGVQCKDVTQMGSMSGDAGKCMPSQSVWLAERSWYKEDIICNECTEHWDPRLMGTFLKYPEYRCLSFCLDAHMHMGDVIVRKRRLTTGINLERCFLIADPRLFVEQCGRVHEATAGILWWADTEQESSESGMAQGVDSDVQINWEKTLTPHQRNRLWDYELHVKSMVRRGTVAPDRMHMYDLDQNCPIGYKGSTTAEDPGPLRTLISHGTIWNSFLQRPLLACEWAVAHGYPQTAYGPKPPVDLFSMMRRGDLSPQQLKSMVGNGWHLPSIGAWVMWLLASVKKVVAEAPMSSLTCAPDGDKADDEATDEEFASASSTLCESPPLKRPKLRTSSPAFSLSPPSGTPLSTQWKAEIMEVNVD